MSIAPERDPRSSAPISITPMRGKPARVLAPLPIPPTLLLGREREINRVAALIRRDDVRLVTLTGPGGVGKTRLAIAVAAELSRDFADGVAYVELGAIRDEALVAATIAGALGIGGGEHAGERLTTHLREQELLLVLDNFEQVVASAPLLSHLFRNCAGLNILVTSRSVLRVSGEWDVAVPPFPLPGLESTPEALSEYAAIRLFIERARAAQSDFVLTGDNAPAIVAICRRLDGLPLAIELAAPRIKVFTPTALAARLEAPLSLLINGPRDLPDRQRTLRDTVVWSVDLLDRAERELFAVLAAFHGGFTLDAAEFVVQKIGSDDRSHVASSVVDGIVSLIDTSLLANETDGATGVARYRMLETIRELATERLAQSDVMGGVRDAHAAYFLELARSAAPELAGATAPGWLDRLTVEHDNVRAALGWLAESGRWHDCLGLAAAMGRFWCNYGHLTEGRAWLERTLDPTRTGGAPPSLRAQAADSLGFIALYQGDYDRAEACGEAARTVWRHLGEAAGLARALYLLGAVDEYRGDDAGAEARYEEALAAHREAGNIAGVAIVLENLGDAAYRRGDAMRALTLAEEAVDTSRASANAVALATPLVGLAQAAAALGDRRRASEALLESLRLSLNVGFDMGVADALTGFADVAGRAGDAERAARLLGAIDTLLRELGTTRVLHHAMQQRATSAARAALGEPVFNVSFTAGQALTPEEAMAEATVASSDVLSPREREIFRLLAGGQTNRSIAQALYISERTVDSHVARIYRKLDVRTRARAIAAGRAAGLLVSSSPDPV